MNLLTPNYRSNLSPAVEASAAEAWQIADEMARDAARLRDNLAAVWSEAGEKRRVTRMLKIQSLVHSIKSEVDEAVRRAGLSAGARNKEWKHRHAQRQAALCEQEQNT